MKIFTVGYEGCDIEDFTAFLKKAKIRHLVDVRKNPISRKKGFSKNKMAEALAKHKISYQHVPTLGVPTEWRKQAKAETITRKKMFSDYKKKIIPKAESELKIILSQAVKDDLVILCYECDALDCHRSYVTEALLKLSGKKLKIENLIPQPERINASMMGK